MTQKQQTIEEQAPTIEEAIDAGLAKLGLSKDRVEIEIIDEGRRGLLGIGGRDAIVRLRVLDKTSEKSGREEAPTTPARPEREEPRRATDGEEGTRAAATPPAEPKAKETIADADKRTPPETPPEEEVDEEEIATAKEIVETLLERMGVEATVEVTMTPPDDLTKRRLPVLNISGDDLGLLIGARGETLDAIQHLSRLMVGHRMHRRASFVIDVEGYRKRREQALARLAERMGQKAIDRGQPVTLEPMPSYERRVIHMTLRENAQVRTESTGEGDRRRVRIYPQ